MKTMFYSNIRVSSIQTFLFIFLIFIIGVSKIQAQTTYLSTFPDPTNNFTSSNAGCALGVNPPDLSNAENVASGTLTDYAVLSTQGSILNLNLLCTAPYTIRTKLNLGGLSSIPASGTTTYYAGFRVMVSTLAQLTLLDGSGGSNFNIKTYLNGAMVQSLTGLPLGIDLLAPGVPSNIYFAATQPFNEVQIEVGAGALSLSAASDIRFYYAYASTAPSPIILPVKLTSFTATAEGKNVQLNWNAASEHNLSKYEIEKSNEQASFTRIGSIVTKVSSGEAFYSFTDNNVVSGENLYRLKIVDRDGSIEYSKIISIKNTIAPKWKVYPTLLRSGEEVNVVTETSNSKAQIQVANLQGQTLRSIGAPNSKVLLSTSGLATGIYIVKLYTNGQLQSQEKIVIQ